ncbi:MAG: hypothetical protein ACHQT5_02195 [Candidatus Saccharimonadales bacterium]|jgi:hypothetical protein
MKLFPKRRTPPEDEIGRRRPMRTEQGQSRVFSYYANRSANELNLGRGAQEEMSKRRSPAYTRFMHRLPIVSSTILLIVVVFSQLVLTSNPKIVILSTTSNSTLFLRSTAIYHDEAQQLFRQSISNHNKLTVDAAGISAILKAKNPELSDVSVALPVVGNQPIVYIQPSEPSFVLSANGGSYVLDSTGRALANAQTVPSHNVASLPAVTDQSGLQPRVGAAVLPSTSVTFMQTILAQLKAQHLSVRQIVLPHAAFEADMYITGKPYFVKFNMQDTAGALQQAGAYSAVSQNLASRNITPSQYIDVRIDGRAYYK